MAKKPPLLDNVRHVIRTKHYSYSTEMTYIDWIYRYILFHDKRYLKEMDTKEISEFLIFLAVDPKRWLVPLKTRGCTCKHPLSKCQARPRVHPGVSGTPPSLASPGSPVERSSKAAGARSPVPGPGRRSLLPCPS